MIPDGAVDKVYDAMLNSPFDDLRGSIRDALNSIVADLLREAILTVEVDGRIVVVRTPTETQNVVERDVWNQLGDEILRAGRKNRFPFFPIGRRAWPDKALAPAARREGT